MSVYGYHHHHGDSLKFFGDNKNNSLPFLGVELEVDSERSVRSDPDDISDYIEDMFPRSFIYFEDDGSLDYGFENITAPATFDYHKSLFTNYCDAFKYILSEGLFSYNVKSCGLHVHFNRNYFDNNEQLENLLYIFDKYWDQIVLLSRRDKDSIGRWSAKYNDTPQKIVEFMYNLSRYHCVNLSNTDTIEIRIFKGTLNPYVYFATLAFVNEIIKISKYKSIDEIRSMKWEDFLPDETKALWEKVKNREVE